MNKSGLILSIIPVLSLLFPLAVSAQNPFLQDRETNSEQVDRKNLPKPLQREVLNDTHSGAYDSFLSLLNGFLLSLNERISAIIEKIKNGDSAALAILLILSLFYGVIHAVGPGHGKGVVVAYFLARQAKVGLGLRLGFFIAILHASSALLLVTGLFYIIKESLLINMNEAGRYLQIASYLLIFIIGLFLFLHTLMDLLQKKKKITTSVPEKNVNVKEKNIWWVALSIGIIPCPGVSMILIFALNLEIIWAGILAAILVSIGMGLTISLFALSAIMAKKALLKAGNGTGALANSIFYGTELIGSILIIIIASALLQSLL